MILRDYLFWIFAGLASVGLWYLYGRQLWRLFVELFLL